jgi:hypothetical protein
VSRLGWSHIFFITWWSQHKQASATLLTYFTSDHLLLSLCQMNLLLTASAAKADLPPAHDSSAVSLLRNAVYNFRCNIRTQ